MRRIMTRFSLPIGRPLLPPGLALMRVTSRSGMGVYASCDRLFKGAVFGRDSIEVAEDILTIKPRLVRRIILTLASLQGEINDDTSEEEPGKIIHEYRTSIVDGKPLKGVPKQIFTELAERWGGDEHVMAYYGSIDATPHYVRLVGKYCDLKGGKILSEKIRLRSGHKLSVQLAVENAVDWTLKQLSVSQSGFLEYQRRNPHGIENQVWKDSREFYVHSTGQLANHNAPIASIEVQALAYDALLAAAELLPYRAEELLSRAERLRQDLFKHYWLPKQRYFALGTDYDTNGAARLIRTGAANAASLLDSRIFDGLSEKLKQKYVSGIVATMFGRDFLTDAGIRSRCLSASHLIKFWDYHGSFTTWPKETYDIAKGLKRQGFPLLARELENRLLNVVFKSRQYPEFIYVDEWGRVLASAPPSKEHGELLLVDSTNQPEQIQAWTVSAVLAIAVGRLSAKLKRTPRNNPQTWQSALEKDILACIPRVNHMLNPIALSARYPKYQYKLSRRAKGS